MSKPDTATVNKLIRRMRKMREKLGRLCVEVDDMIETAGDECPECDPPTDPGDPPPGP